MTSRFPREPATRALARAAKLGMPAYMQELNERYPEIVTINFGIDQLFVLSNPALVRDFFVDNSSRVHKASALKDYSPLLGNGLLTSEGEHWRSQRRLVQPGFHRDRMNVYIEQIASAAREHSAGWADGARIDISSEMAQLTLRIVVNALFGDGIDEEGFTEALTDVLSGSSSWMIPGIGLMRRLPTPAYRRVMRSTHYLDTLVDGLVRQHDAEGNDLLALLLQARDERDRPMSHQQVKDEVMTLILAGHQTTAMALTWAWMLLHKYPKHLATLYEEIDSDLPEPAHAVQALPFTRAVFAEALRLYPPAWLMGRRTIETIRLGQWTIPSNATVVAAPFALQRSSRSWTQGSEFNPQRWIIDGKFNDEAPGQPAGAWFPFGMGQRKCVGQHFAWAEGVLILATLARDWRVDIDQPKPVKLVPAITLRPRNGMPATLSCR